MFEPWQRGLLLECRVARLGTIDPRGRPRLVPVCYALVDDRVAIAIDEKPKSTPDVARLRDVRRDPRCTLLADRWSEDWETLAWVRLDASAEVLAAGAVWPEAVTALRARYPQYLDMDLESRPLLRLTVEHVAGWQWTASETSGVTPPSGRIAPPDP